MAPKKSLLLPKTPRTRSPEPEEEPREQIKEVEEDPEEAEGEGEEWEEIEEVEEEIEAEDPEEEEEWEEIEEEVEEDPEEAEGEERDVEEDPEDVEEYGKETEVEERQKGSNLILSNSKHEGERKECEESDYPPSPSAADFTIMAIAPKWPAPKDPEPTKKRLSETERDDEGDSRSRKKAKNNEEEERKDKSLSTSLVPVAVGRVWCQEDEISILEGMIDYKKKEGDYPPNDMVAFHEFIKWKLYGDISRSQLYEKVKRLRKKFLINLEKVEDSIDPVLSKPHDYIIFDLSRRIWGSSMANSSRADANAKTKDRKLNKRGKIGSIVKEAEKKDAEMDDLEADTRDFESKYPYLSESLYKEGSSFVLADGVKSSVKDKMSLIGNAKAEELEKQWKKVREQEAQIFLKKMNLIAQQTKLMLEATKDG